MVIQSLDLRHFRNYTHLQTEFSPETNWIFGKNGQGKTNLVEAIYYICNLESFRTRKNHHLLQSGHPQALIQAELNRSDVLHQIRIQITSRGRQVRLDHSGTILFQDSSGLCQGFVAEKCCSQTTAKGKTSAMESNARQACFNHVGKTEIIHRISESPFGRAVSGDFRKNRMSSIRISTVYFDPRRNRGRDLSGPGICY